MKVSNKNFFFTSFGFGPMVEDWYPYLMGDEGVYENGFLKIGSLRVRNYNENSWKYIYFFLDLGGTIQPHCIIELHIWKLGELSIQDFLHKPKAYSSYWSKIANSFSQWLELAATTEGSLGYLKE